MLRQFWYENASCSWGCCRTMPQNIGDQTNPIYYFKPAGANLHNARFIWHVYMHAPTKLALSRQAQDKHMPRTNCQLQGRPSPRIISFTCRRTALCLSTRTKGDVRDIVAFVYNPSNPVLPPQRTSLNSWSFSIPETILLLPPPRC